ncbi:hypothetical protein [Maricaulis virginensis]|uniref:Uncharacterized protein n=1 Tax=Maricaulis virginensis TaxID=144022 RepID=A0A9W6MP65_9PROT|nr:hypothetical protein [Maricaulis virginensis]GLK52828.1 hypothetical protein GCM10017621_23360 [Maricaulis virginensis]
MVLATALLAAPAAFAQTGSAPARECSPEDIRQALAGAYTGPACRFTQMPDEAQRPQPSGFSADVTRLEGAPRQTRRTDVAQLHHSYDIVTTYETRSSDTVRHRVTQTADYAPASRETLTLDPSFFTGALAGGVERPFTPLYSYRGIVLISASGEVRTRFAGLSHTARQVRAMDTRRAHAPARAYPYD